MLETFDIFLLKMQLVTLPPKLLGRARTNTHSPRQRGQLMVLTQRTTSGGWIPTQDFLLNLLHWLLPELFHSSLGAKDLAVRHNYEQILLFLSES